MNLHGMGIVFCGALLALATTGYAAPSGASTQTVEAESARLKNKFGSFLAINEPSPTLIGLNLAYNVTDFMRVSAGYGKISVTSSISIGPGGIVANEASASTFGLGVRGFVPGWDVSPTLGLHYAYVAYSGEGLEVGGFAGNGGHVYTTLGIDWQTAGGFNLGTGLKYSFKSGIGAGFYLAAGWFVNWLA